MATSLTTVIRTDTLSPALRSALTQLNPPTPVLRAMGLALKSITEGNFSSLGASFRPTPWPAKRDGKPSNLKLTTTLSKSFRLAVTPTAARVSTDRPYAAIHQVGGTIKAKPGKALRFRLPDGRWVYRKSVKIPPRPFFPVVAGKFTPAAAKLIEAAGQRALAKALGPPV